MSFQKLLMTFQIKGVAYKVIISSLLKFIRNDLQEIKLSERNLKLWNKPIHYNQL